MKGIMGVEKNAALVDALHEARRFMDAATKALDLQRNTEIREWRSKEMAQVKRSSLDLSAALIKFRKIEVGQ
jgi:hypothetical protein